ncbi:MAG: hypothetical protein ABIP34_12740 [Rhodoferax sp.]
MAHIYRPGLVNLQLVRPAAAIKKPPRKSSAPAKVPASKEK